MRPFRHTDAGTLSEAIHLLVEYGDKALVIAGGTDLLGLLKTRVLPVYPDLLINIKRIEGLDRIESDENGLRIGALTRLSDICDSAEVNQGYPGLARAALSVAMPQIRNMGTLGGNLAQETRCWYYRYPQEIGGQNLCPRKGEGPCLAVAGDNRYHALFGGKKCFAVCPSDTAVALAVLDARLNIVGPEGKRLLNIGDFYHPLGNALGPGEIITHIEIPRPSVNHRQAFIKFRVRESIYFSIVRVSAVCTIEQGVCSSARIVLGAVAPGPYRAAQAEQVLSGKVINPETAEAAAEAAVAGAVPLSRNAYKIEIAKSLVKKAILECSPAA